MYVLSAGRCLLVCLSLLGTACQFFGQAENHNSVDQDQAAGAGLEAQVEELLSRLDAPQRAVRDQAERDLMALGRQAIPFLQPKRMLSPEAALRLARVRTTLIEQIVATDALPTRVTCKVTDLPLSEVVTKIAHQTGNAVTVSDEVAKLPVTWDCQEKTFWEALDELAALVDADVSPAETGGLVILPQKNRAVQSRVAVAYCGVFRVRLRDVIKIERQHNTSQVSLVRIEIAWEPRLQPAVIWWRGIHIDREQPESAAIEDKTLARREVPVSPRRCSIILTLPVTLPSDLEQKPAVLRGSFEPVLPIGATDVVFDLTDLQKGPRSVILGRSEIAAELQRRSANTCEVGLRVRYEEACGAFASHRGWFYSWPVYLDTDGKKALPRGVQLLRMTEDGVTLLYQFGNAEVTGTRMVCRVPLAIVKPVVEFQLALSLEERNRSKD